MTLYIEINGSPVSAKDVVWIERAPCGCISGVSFHNAHAQSDDEMHLTGAQFAAGFDTPKAVIQRAREDGFTQEPMSEADWDSISQGFVGGCPHAPKWGRAVAPIPEGMGWTTTDQWYGKRTFYRHLVTRPVRDHPYPAALCGSKSKKPWSIDSNDLHDTVTCRKCEAAATSLAAS